MQEGRRFLNLVVSVAAFGLVLGVAILVLVVSVLNGFERELRERVLALLPHIVVAAPGGYENWPEAAEQLGKLAGVAAIAPLTQGAVLAAGESQVRGATLIGVLPEAEATVSALPRFLDDTGLRALAPTSFRALVGRGLADQLGLAVGDGLVVVLPDTVITPLGPMPRQKRLTVAEVFHSGSELDQRAIFIHVEDAGRLYRMGERPASLRVRLDDLFAARATARTIAGEHPGLRVSDWGRTHGGLYQAIQVQRATLFVLLCLVVAVAAFNVVSSLVIIATDKQAEVAILRTLGLGTRGVMGIFLVLGLLVGLTGIGVGLVVGTTFAVLLPDLFAQIEAWTGQQLLGQYFIDYLPSEVRLNDLVMTAAVSAVLVFAASLYPAWRAARRAPADVLRYE